MDDFGEEPVPNNITATSSRRVAKVAAAIAGGVGAVGVLIFIGFEVGSHMHPSPPPSRPPAPTSQRPVVSVPSTTPSQPTHTLTIPLHPPWTFLHPTRSTPQR